MAEVSRLREMLSQACHPSQMSCSIWEILWLCLRLAILARHLGIWEILWLCLRLAILALLARHLAVFCGFVSGLPFCNVSGVHRKMVKRGWKGVLRWGHHYPHSSHHGHCLHYGRMAEVSRLREMFTLSQACHPSQMSCSIWEILWLCLRLAILARHLGIWEILWLCLRLAILALLARHLGIWKILWLCLRLAILAILARHLAVFACHPSQTSGRFCGFVSGLPFCNVSGVGQERVKGCVKVRAPLPSFLTSRSLLALWNLSYCVLCEAWNQG